jgi:hypothetical protein
LSILIDIEVVVFEIIAVWRGVYGIEREERKRQG